MEFREFFLPELTIQHTEALDKLLQCEFGLPASWTQSCAVPSFYQCASLFALYTVLSVSSGTLPASGQDRGTYFDMCFQFL